MGKRSIKRRLTLRVVTEEACSENETCSSYAYSWPIVDEWAVKMNVHALKDPGTKYRYSLVGDLLPSLYLWKCCKRFCKISHRSGSAFFLFVLHRPMQWRETCAYQFVSKSRSSTAAVCMFPGTLASFSKIYRGSSLRNMEHWPCLTAASEDVIVILRSDWDRQAISDEHSHRG